MHTANGQVRELTRTLGSIAIIPSLFWGSVACASTEDSIGYNDIPIEIPIGGAVATGEYPNAVGDVLGVTDAETDTKLESYFQQLFHGDPETESVYYEVDADSAYIEDINHGDVRTDGIGYALMITVQLDKQEEFDRIWTWAKSNMEFDSGPYEGMLSWTCLPDVSSCSTTPDPNGTSYIATALLFAESRWGAGDGILAYGDQARSLIRPLLHLEEENGGVVEAAHNPVNLDNFLVVYSPQGSASTYVSPAGMLPAFYHYWALTLSEDVSDWYDVATASREFLHEVAHPETGLFPEFAEFDATPRTGEDWFGPEALRVPLNLAVDQVWLGADPWQVDEVDRFLEFLYGQGIDTYLSQYTLDGAPVVTFRATALRATAGAAAVIATIDEREEFIRDAWELELATGQYRYYDGMLHLLSLLAVTGRFRVY